jgi:transposase-like protein
MPSVHPAPRSTAALADLCNKAPLIEKMAREHKRLVGGSWRMGETCIKVKGVWKYLYRAVDKQGKTVDFLLVAKRDMPAAKGSVALANVDGSIG